MNSGFIFIGGHKINKCDYDWFDNSGLNFTYWESGEPSQTSTENCMILWKYKWYDLPCDGSHRANYICEYPSSMPFTTKDTQQCDYQCNHEHCIKDVRICVIFNVNYNLYQK